MSQLKAIVFDMDGLMVDSEPLSQQAWDVYLRPYGHQLTAELVSRIIGLRDGHLAFDLPVSEVTGDHLARLYDQFEHELRGEAPQPEASAPPVPPPAVMHCR